MELATFSFMELYLTLLGWVINNGIFQVLKDTSLAAWPIAAIIFNEWLRARGEGADEGNKAVLTVYRIENKVYVAYMVIIFAFIPAIDVHLVTLKPDPGIDNSCILHVVSAQQVQQSPVGKEFQSSIGHRTAKIPLWWAMVHSLSQGITKAAVTAIPCDVDFRETMMKIDAIRISDKQLLAELTDFDRQCYRKARYILSTSGTMLDEDKQFDVDWIGSDFFRNTSGYYDKLFSEHPRKGWAYNDTADAGRPKPEDGSGYPSCKDWWENSTNGIRKRVLAVVDTSFLEDLGGFFNIGGDTAEEVMLRNLVSPEHQKASQGYKDLSPDYSHNARSRVGRFFSNLGGAVNDGATEIGLIAKMPSMITSMNALKVALPMIQAFLIMAVIVTLPILLVLGRYELKMVMSISFGLFAIYFCSFWWELARWIDSSLYSALYNQIDVGRALGEMFSKSPAAAFADSMDNGVTMLVMQFVMATLFYVWPPFFFSIMAWAGVHVGAGITSALGNGTASSKAAGAAGAGIAMSLAGKVAGGAASLATGGMAKVAKVGASMLKGKK